MKALSLDMVRGSMQVLLGSCSKDIMTVVGCSEEEWNLVTGKAMWQGVDRTIVGRTLQQLMYGLVDMMGVPRLELPVEFVVAVVYTFVSPVNYFTACAWLGSYKRGVDIQKATLDEVVEGIETLPASAIFSNLLVVAGRGDLKSLGMSFAKKVEAQLGCTSVESVPPTKDK